MPKAGANGNAGEPDGSAAGERRTA